MSTEPISFDEQRQQIQERRAAIPARLQEAREITRPWPERRRVLEEELLPTYARMSKALRRARRPVSGRKLRVEMIRLRCLEWRVYWHPRFWQKRLELIPLGIRAYRRFILLGLVFILILLGVPLLVWLMTRVIWFFISLR